jgi:hypothetical protein
MSEQPKTVPMPRFQGLAIELKTGGWGFEIHITIGPTEPIVMSFEKTAYISRDAALDALKRIIPGVMKETCKAIGLPEPAAIHDLKTNELSNISEWLKKK